MRWGQIAFASAAMTAALGNASGRLEVQQAVAERVTLERVFAAYAAGDDHAVERWLPALMAHARDVERSWLRPAPWSRMRAAFLLEMAIATPMQHRDRAEALLQAGRGLVMGRTTRLGASNVDDRFEILWHQAAMGMLLARPDVAAQRRYLDVILPRFERARQAGLRLETRLPLIEGMVEATICCWKAVNGAAVRDISDALKHRSSLESALAEFERAARDPRLAGEAHIRAGVLLYDAGRFDQALATLARVPPGEDAQLTYIRYLTQARALEMTGAAAADAAAAYDAARAAAPDDQTAGIGLAAARLRAGQVSDAVKIADEVRRTRSRGGRGPLSTFQRGDARFLSQWLSEIRRLRW